MFDRKVCTGDKSDINDALESMVSPQVSDTYQCLRPLKKPSGHSTAAFAGLMYLTFYFNAQLKVMSAHNPAYWKFILMMCPVLGAVLIAGALTIDECKFCYCTNHLKS